MSTIVITGASGFIGRYLHAHLIASGAAVVAVSRKNRTGMLHVEDYRHSPDGDVLIHLAEEPDRALVNGAGEVYLQTSASLVTALARRKFPRLVYISSGAVYGDKCQHPCKSSDTVVANDVYSRAKLINEDIVLASGGAVARLANVYGEGMAASNVISDIIAQIPTADSLKVRDETPIRDYLHVNDLVQSLEKFASSDYCGVINIATGVGTSVRRVAEIALSAAGQAGRQIVSSGSMKRPVSTNILDITETNSVLGWTPRIGLVDGLTELVQGKNWFKT
jgi:nucleoside-diphosphate-sugar epimerase